MKDWLSARQACCRQVFTLCQYDYNMSAQSHLAPAGAPAENGRPEGGAPQQKEEKEPKKDRLSAREAAAGRLGGGGRRIVYDDAAIEALLDRSGLEKGTVRYHLRFRVVLSLYQVLDYHPPSSESLYQVLDYHPTTAIRRRPKSDFMPSLTSGAVRLPCSWTLKLTIGFVLVGAGSEHCAGAAFGLRALLHQLLPSDGNSSRPSVRLFDHTCSVLV